MQRKKRTVRTIKQPEIGCYKVYNNKNDPVKDLGYATENSACFDLRCYIPEESVVKVFDENNNQLEIFSRWNDKHSSFGIILDPGMNALLPTGYIFDIPEGYCMEVFPRSGKSVKEKLNIINCVGMIDEDYVEQTYITLFNNSKKRAFIKHHERLVQAKVEKVEQVRFKNLMEPPAQKTRRNGGFNSTGSH